MSREITNASGKIGVQAELDVTGSLVFLNQNGPKFREATGGGTNTVTLQAPAALAADYTLTLPTTAGSSTQILASDGSGNLQWAANGFSAFAVQSDMETPTSTTLSLDPAVTKYHPGSAKAHGWMTNGTLQPGSYNIASTSRTSVGQYVVNLTTPFSSANYAIECSSSNPTFRYIPPPRTTTSFGVTTFNSSVSVADSTYVSFICFGDQ